MIAEKEQDTDPARFPEDRLVGRRKKANGETICLIAHQRDLTDDITKLIVDAVSKLIIHTDNKESILISSLLITSHDDQIGPTNPPTILDIETGMENIKFSYK